MSLLNTPFWQDLDGNPRTGVNPPSLVMRSGRLTPQRHGEIQQIYMRFSLAKLTAVGEFFVFNRVLSDGTRVRLESMRGQDRVFVWAGAPSEDEQVMTQGWRALPSSSIEGDNGWVRHRTTGALLQVAGGDGVITRPGYEGTNPHVFIAAENGDVTLNSKHVAGGWYWTDHKTQRLLFAEDGAHYLQKLVSFHVGGVKVEGPILGGGIAGGWILLVVADKLYALKKSAVELSTDREPVAAVVVGSVPTWKIPKGLRPIWRFSPDGLKAVAVEGLGRVDKPADKHLSSRGPTTGAQFIRRLELTATSSSTRPFSLSVREEVRQNSVLKIQPRYQLATNEWVSKKFEFLRWDAYASAVIRYRFHFGFSSETYHWARQNGDTYLHQQEYDELAEAVWNVQADLPTITPGFPIASAILNPQPGMRDYALEPVPAPPPGQEPDPVAPYRFYVSFTDADGRKAYASGTGAVESPGGKLDSVTTALVSNGNGAAQVQGANIYVYQPDENRIPWQPPPPAPRGHIDFVRSAPTSVDDLENDYYDLRVLAPGWTGTFEDTYHLAETRRPLDDVLQEGKDLVAFYADQTRPNEVVPATLTYLDRYNAKVDETVQQHLYSPTTLEETLVLEVRARENPLNLKALPSCVFRYTDGGMTNLGLHLDGPMTVNESNPDRLLADSTFWERHYTNVDIHIRPIPAFNLYSIADYTAATTWAYAGRCIVDIDYGEDGDERVLELVADESQAVRYDVSMRAVDVYSGELTTEAQAQRSLSGSCRFTLQLDGDVVAQRVLSASDSFSGFLWTERPEDWKNFASGVWTNIWGQGNYYDIYLGQTRDINGTGQIANTEASGSMACQVSSSGFELLDWDVRFGHVLLADTTQQATRTTKTTANNAERTSGTIGVSLWDNGKKRVLRPPVQVPEVRAMWQGAVPMLQRMLYRGASLTRPAVYLTGKTPPAYRFGINGFTPGHVGEYQFNFEMAQALAPDGSTLDVFGDPFRTMVVFPDYEAVLAPPQARALSEVGNAYTLGYVLSYSPKVWLAVVNRERMPAYSLALPSFSVVRAKTFEQPSTAKRLGQLLPYLQTVASAGALALPGYVI